MVCLRKAVDFETWKKISEFLSKIRGTVIDDECADAFMDAFTGVSVMNMEDSQIEKSLWEKVPREKIELTFEQIKNIAGFFARIVDYKSPLQVHIQLAWLNVPGNFRDIWDSMMKQYRKCILPEHCMISEKLQ